MSHPRAQHEFVATCTSGAEGVLADEVRSFGIHDVRELPGAVSFTGDLSAGYRVCLWSRLASRCLIVLGTFPGDTADALYEGVGSIPWAEHLGIEQTIACSFVGTSRDIRNSHFGAMRTKDAVVDALRAIYDARPSVDLDAPDIRIHVHLRRGTFSVALDMAGEPLNRRGYLREAGAAPIKENLAATILHLAEWPEAARMGAPLVDPMCGSGTFLLEGAGMALDRAPGLGRERWGFSAWRQHDGPLWAAELREADERRAAAAHRQIGVYGADVDPELVRLSRVNAQRAELPIELKRADVREGGAPRSPRRDRPYGLLVTNPPYGERLGDVAGAERVGRALGNALRTNYLGWRAFVIAGSRELADGIGITPTRLKPLFNGPIECRLLQLDVQPRQRS